MFKSSKRLGHIPYAVFVKILDCQIVPHVLYAAEICGLKEVPEIEKVHVLALEKKKKYLNVFSKTPNMMVYGENGPDPLFVLTAVKAMKHWFRVVTMSQERHTRKAYKMLVYTDSTGKENWATWLRTFLCLRDFSHARLHQGTGDTGRVISDLKAKLIEMSAHTWQENLHSSNRSDVHTNYKKKKHTLL